YGNAMPGRTISVNEAMTMALRAIGYTANSSLLVGAWPANYVSLAQNSDLYDDVAATTTVDKANAAQIIYNLLTVQKVAVNSDGTTDYLWDGKASLGIEANLLNTNLGCTEDEDVILGADYDYDDAIINITKNIGAYGTAYLNSDDELVAFTKDSTALTGSLNAAMDTFTVGDVEYDISNTANTYTTPAYIKNTVDTVLAVKATVGGISAWAVGNSDDGDTVTLNVDLSGKKIKDIYSVVAWKANDADLADSDVQEVITEDYELLSGSFAETDDDVIDFNSFELVGVTSLDKIAEDNVVAIYTDGTDIRKVTVGTEVIEGTIDEINDSNDELTIGGKDYDVSSLKNHDTFSATDVDADGTFYLDVDGAVFSFDGTASTDTYGVVKAATAETAFDNYKVKLYKSGDSTSTLYLAESDPADIDWTDSTVTTIAAVTTGALIGYSLDSDGDIDAINNTVKIATNGAVLKSASIFENIGIADNAVAFTYTGTPTAVTTYDVVNIADIEKGSVLCYTATAPAYYILNEDGDVAALFVESALANVDDDAVYGVINSRTATSTDGDDVYKFTGFIDGTEFTYKTDDRTNTGVTGHTSYGDFAGEFGIYAITLDATDTITKIDVIAQYVKDTNSGWINAATEEVVTALASSNTKISTASGMFPVADNAVVYKYDVDDEEFTVGKLSAIDEGDSVMLYDTDGTDADGIADVVIYHEN
ncbi:MAG: hypothetical protein PHE79_10210, partial [Eubacteriales bacterium]|nr:hypothetical protein [Eubacteriales bacterium]